MTQDYDPHSCNALQRPFYRPVEAAIRWCNLASREVEILEQLGMSHVPKTGQFPMWPCLKANTEKILDAIEHGDIPHGRDGKAIAPGEHVAPHRITVRHADLMAWLEKLPPENNRPSFIFDTGGQAGTKEEKPLTARERNRLHRIIGGLLELTKNPREGRNDDAAVIRELVQNYSDKEGISERKLQEVFPLAKKLLEAD